MKINGFDYPEDLYYDRYHSWAKVEGNQIIQGLTDLGQALAQDIVFVGLPRLNRPAKQGETLVSLESGKWVGRVPAIVSGTVSAVNSALEDNAADIHNAPYTDGWIIRIECADLSEERNLLRADSIEYETFVNAEIVKYKKVLKR